MPGGLLLVGANPGVRLVDADGLPTAFASLWHVEWSPAGSGDVIVLVTADAVTIVGERPELGAWLADTFVRWFPEVDGLGWHEPQVIDAPVTLELGAGLASASGGGVAVRIDGALDLRSFGTDDFELGGVPHALSLVLAPCAAGVIEVDGERLAGEPQRSGTDARPGSSAFVALAEVWRTLD